MPTASACRSKSKEEEDEEEAEEDDDDEEEDDEEEEEEGADTAGARKLPSNLSPDAGSTGSGRLKAGGGSSSVKEKMRA